MQSYKTQPAGERSGFSHGARASSPSHARFLQPRRMIAQLSRPRPGPGIKETRTASEHRTRGGGPPSPEMRISEGNGAGGNNLSSAPASGQAAPS